MNSWGAEHVGPHIPNIQWEPALGFITNTNITTFVFLVLITIFSVIWNRALKSKKKSRLKVIITTYIETAYNYLIDSFDSRKDARKYFWIVIWIFTIVFFGNVFGILVDWFASSISESLFAYIRPMHSDLNTTLVLAMIAVFSSLMISAKEHWSLKTLRSYIFNFSGDSIIEKCINVFVWWLHTIGLFSTMASLSLRLFGNIFAGVVLLGVVLFLLSSQTLWLLDAWRLVSLPFWFFELFVSLVQGIVFMWLTIGYFKSAKEEH